MSNKAWLSLTKADVVRELRLAWRRACDDKPHPPVLRMLNENRCAVMRIRWSWKADLRLEVTAERKFVVWARFKNTELRLWKGDPGRWKKLLDGLEPVGLRSEGEDGSA